MAFVGPFTLVSYRDTLQGDIHLALVCGEIDPDQPRQRGVSWKTRFRHYTNLGRMEGRLRRLLRDFSWGRMDEVFLDQPQRREGAAK